MEEKYVIFDPVELVELQPKPRRRRRRVRPFALLIYAIIITLLVVGIRAFLSRTNFIPPLQLPQIIRDDAADGEGLTHELPSGLPDSLRELYEKNPEARDFVLGWYDGRTSDAEIDLSNDVTDGSIPLFLQWDTRWGYDTYGSGMLAITGCGPTCLSMVLVGKTGDTAQNPREIARFAESAGYYAEGAGTSWNFMTDGARELGLNVRDVSFTQAGIENALSAGHPIICVLGPGDFTDYGHFIVITELNSDGTVNVHDPNSIVRSEKSWDIEVLMSQIKNLWSYSI